MANEHFHQADDENAQLEHFGSGAPAMHFCGPTQRPAQLPDDVLNCRLPGWPITDNLIISNETFHQPW